MIDVWVRVWVSLCVVIGLTVGGVSIRAFCLVTPDGWWDDWLGLRPVRRALGLLPRWEG